jgi:hypothetical protein
VIFSLVFFLAAAVFAASSSPVFAQTPCVAQASYPTISGPQYYYSNIAVTVPVSTSCSNIVGPLIAIGNAFDTTTTTSVGTASTGLSSGGSGQLQFSIPPSTLGHTVQFSVSIYSNNNGQAGSLLASTSQSITIGSSYYQSYPYYSYPYYSSCYNGYNGYYYNGYYSGSSCYSGYYYSSPSYYYVRSYYYGYYGNGYGYYGYWHHHG